jgi:3-hydroxyacyl-[acyl-carrier-protein] dehydratase
VASEKNVRPVKEILPHREPFLFVDEIADMTDTTIVAKRKVRADEPQFLGHYPGKPIMPGVLLCEAALQAGAYLMAVKHGLDSNMKGAPVVTRLNQVRFKRMVKPGDELEIYAEHKVSKMGAHMMSAIIRCEEKVVCTLEFTVMLAEEA